MTHNTAELLRARTLTVTADAALIAFKVQVQEWKDTLPRGNDKAQFDQYSGQFADQERLTDALLGQLQQMLRDMQLDASAADKALKEHQALGVRYRTALQGFDANDPEAGKKVDATVKGMDRPLADAMAALVGYIEKVAKERSDRSLAEATDIAHSTTLCGWLPAPWYCSPCFSPAVCGSRVPSCARS